MVFKDREPKKLSVKMGFFCLDLGKTYFLALGRGQISALNPAIESLEHPYYFFLAFLRFFLFRLVPFIFYNPVTEGYPVKTCSTNIHEHP